MYLPFVLLGRILHWQSNSVSIMAAMGEVTVHPPTGIWVVANLERIHKFINHLEPLHFCVINSTHLDSPGVNPNT